MFLGATASLRGAANFSLLSSGKFALRSFAQSLAREYQPKGVHVAHVIIDGQVGENDKSKIDPAAVADTYFHLHQQAATAWTHELELRPSGERW